MGYCENDYFLRLFPNQDSSPMYGIQGLSMRRLMPFPMGIQELAVQVQDSSKNGDA